MFAETKTNMKKIFLPFVIIFLFAACGGASSKQSPETAGNELSKNPDYQKGLELISKPGMDCFTCHEIETTKTGPPYREVAKKYANMPDTIITYLAHKVIKGGTGTWGAIYMTPHSSLSQADAETIVKYILLLKK